MRWLLVVLLLLNACTDSRPTLHVFCWTEYISRDILQEFEEKHNCRVVLDAFDSNEVMYAKLRAGFYGYDIIFPSNYYVELLMRQGNGLLKIDRAKVPNLQYLDPTAFKLLDPAVVEYGIPFLITYTGIGYQKERLKDLEPSWGVFSRRDLRGRMTLLNDVREAFGAALRYLGYSINTTRPEEVEQALKLLIKWKKNLAKFENEQYQNGLATAEYLVVQGYGGDILQVAGENPEVGFLIPREGGIFSCDQVVIPASSEKKELAHAFINFLLDPPVLAKVMEHTCLPSPSPKARALLPEFLRDNPGMYPDQKTLDQLEAIKDLGEDVALYNEAWDRLKSD